MKKKVSVSLIIALVMTLILVSGVLAGSIGNIDGVWEYVEDNSGTSNAYCTTYGTGNGSSTTDRSRNNPTIQTPPNTDENQVRYGKGTSQSGNCPSTAPSADWFNAQSGLGFDGNNAPGVVAADQTFLIGRFTHYNSPICLTDGCGTPTSNAYLQWVDLDVTVTGILCTGGDAPAEGSTFTFIYRINFDETPNTPGTCAYPGTTDCPDRIQVTGAIPTMSFTCNGSNVPDALKGQYKLVIDGFIPNATATCPATPSGTTVANPTFYTEENSVNHACVYGRVTGFVPSAVTLKEFSARVVDDGVLVTWETLSEVNTLGFNVYRSESLDGEKIKVNDQLIMSDLLPGSLGGNSYSFNDQEGSSGLYYWLEEIETDGSSISYGWTPVK